MTKKAKAGGAKKAPPQKDETRRAIIRKALQALTDKHGRITPDIIVAAARDPKSPLHREFIWDNEKAADIQRIDRARELITYVTVTVVHKKEKVVSVYYVRDPNAGPKEQGYISLASPDIRRNDAQDIMLAEFDRCQAAIERARGVVVLLDSRFPGLREDLEGLLTEIVKLRRRIDAGGAAAHPAP